jgi:hypothetical protein
VSDAILPERETTRILKRIDDLLREQAQLRQRLEQARAGELERRRFTADRRHGDRRAGADRRGPTR